MIFRFLIAALALCLPVAAQSQGRENSAPADRASSSPLPGYAEIESSFPSMRRVSNAQLFTELGGGFLRLHENSAFANSCGVRISRALLLNHIVIPAKGYNTLQDGQGGRYIFRSLELKSFLSRSVFGAPAVHHGFDAALTGRHGIIVFAANFTDNNGRVISTGHIDLWNGSACVSQDCSSYFNYHGKAVPVYFWSLR